MKALMSKFVGAWTSPWATMRAVKAESQGGLQSTSALGCFKELFAGIGSSILLVFVVGILNGIIMSLIGLKFPPPLIESGQAAKETLFWTAAFLPFAYVIGSFLLALFVWVLTTGALRGSGQDFQSAYRLVAVTVAFSPAATLFAPIPSIGEWVTIAVNLWALIVLIQGIVIVMGTSAKRTWTTFVIIFVSLFLLTLYAMFAAQQANQFGRAGFDPALDTGSDINDEEFNRQMQNMLQESESKTKTKKAN